MSNFSQSQKEDDEDGLKNTVDPVIPSQSNKETDNFNDETLPPTGESGEKIADNIQELDETIVPSDKGDSGGPLAKIFIHSSNENLTSKRVNSLPETSTEFSAKIDYASFFGTKTIGHRLGKQSGQGLVFKVTQQTEPFNTFVVKVPLPQVMEKQELAKRFARESRLASAAKGEKIASFLCYVDLSEIDRVREATGYSEGKQIIGAVYEYIDGPTLDSFLTDQGNESELQRKILISVFKGVIKAVDYLHREGVIHRDLKPDNIIVERDSELNIKAAWVIDLGIAKIANHVTKESSTGSEVNETQNTYKQHNSNSNFPLEEMTTAGMFMGTPGYISPEQARGALEIDKRADIFSLGCIFYKILCNQLPFNQDSYKATITYTSPTFPSELNHEVDPILGSIVMKMIKENPNERYQSLSAVLKDIDNWEKKKLVSAYVESPDISKLRKSTYKIKMLIKANPRVSSAVLTIAGILLLAGIRYQSKRGDALKSLKKAESEASNLLDEGDIKSAISKYSTGNVLASEYNLNQYEKKFTETGSSLKKLDEIRSIASRVNVSNVTLLNKTPLIPLYILNVEKDLFRLFVNDNVNKEFDYKKLYSTDFNSELNKFIEKSDIPYELENEAKINLHETLYFLLVKRFMGNEYIPLSKTDSKLAYNAFINRDKLVDSVSLSSVTARLQILKSNPDLDTDENLFQLKQFVNSFKALSANDFLFSACGELNSGLELPESLRAQELLRQAKAKDKDISSLSNFLAASAEVDKNLKKATFSQEALVNLIMTNKELGEPYFLAMLIDYIFEHPTKYSIVDNDIIQARIESGLNYEVKYLETSLHLAMANFAMSKDDFTRSKILLSKIDEIRKEREDKFGLIEEDIRLFRTKNRFIAKASLRKFGYLPYEALAEYKANIDSTIEVAKANEDKDMPRVYNTIVGDLVFLIKHTLSSPEDESEETGKLDFKKYEDLIEESYEPAIYYMEKAIEAFKMGKHDVHPKDKGLIAPANTLLNKKEDLKPEFVEVLKEYIKLPRFY